MYKEDAKQAWVSQPATGKKATQMAIDSFFKNKNGGLLKEKRKTYLLNKAEYQQY